MSIVKPVGNDIVPLDVLTGHPARSPYTPRPYTCPTTICQCLSLCSRSLNKSANATGGMSEIDENTASDMSQRMIFDAPNTYTSYFRLWTLPASPNPPDYLSP